MTRVIRPDDVPWTEPAEGVRYRATIRGDCRIRIVQFAPGFAEADWCCAAHIGYVINGILEVVFADSIELLSPGDILIIGAGDKHRARVIEGPVNLFLVEEPPS